MGDDNQDAEPIVSDVIRDGLSDDEQSELDRAQAIAQGMVGGVVTDADKYDPKAEEALEQRLHDGEYEDDSEFGEPEGEGVTDVDDTMQDSDVHPYVVTMVFFGAARRTEEDQFVDVLEQVIKDAEGRGLFHFHSSMGIMKMEHVAPGSPLHQAVTGQP